MIPSRGLRPAHFTPFAVRQSLYARSLASRQFSSVPRNSTFAATSRQTNPLHAANWRAGAATPYALSLNASTVRHGSWYAPWTWGRSSNPSPNAAPDTSAELAQSSSASAPEPTVTTATLELAPAGIESAPVVESTSTAAGSVEASIVELAQSAPLPTFIDHFGALKELGLDYGWGFTAFFEWWVEHIYIWSGAGWGASILLSAAVMRASMFWFQLRASDNMAKMAAVNPLLKDLNEEMRAAIKNGDAHANASLRAKQQRIYKDVGVKPFAAMLPMVGQGLLGFGAFRCLRGMSNLPAPGFEHGGFLWFQNLAVADPYYVLPCLGAGVFWALLKFGGETGAANQTMSDGTRFAMTNGMPLLMAGFTAFQPAGLQLYLLFVTLLGTGTTLLLRNPAFRRWRNLAPLPTPEAQKMWGKVAKGEIPLDKVMTPDGKFIAFPAGQALPTAAASNTPTYQAPTAPVSRKLVSRTPARKHAQSHQFRGLNVKAGAAIPLHLQERVTGKPKVDPATADRDYDYDTPPENFMDKVDWLARNFTPKYVWRRFMLWVANQTESRWVRKRLLQSAEDVKLKKAEEAAIRRRGGIS